ncbi:hypothetical protein GCM10023212_31210 [Luteolibacter yonseiensis]
MYIRTGQGNDQRFVMRRFYSFVAICAILLLTLPASIAGIRGLYVGNDFYPLGTDTEQRVKDSGFNRVFLFTAKIQSNGDVYYNDSLIATNGSYVGASNWELRLAAVKQGGRIGRIELCIGSWGSGAFDSIRDLVASQGTGSGSILYRNFRAIRNALPSIDAIQYDDEKTYHASSAAAFGGMLADMGYKVTLCPYNWGTRTFWQSVKSQLGAACDAIYLQCYDGGKYNNPADWNNLFGGFRVTPGLWGNEVTTDVCIEKFRTWNKNSLCNGGFMWLNSSVQWDVDLWGDCMNVALEPLPYFMIVNKTSGKSIGLNPGNASIIFNGAASNQWTYDYDEETQRWALMPTPDRTHFKIVSCISGRVICPVGKSTSNGAQMHTWMYNKDESQMWDVIYSGDGWYKIKNFGSGKVLDVADSNTDDNGRIQQWTDDGSANSSQLFRLHPWGEYRIKTLANKYVAVEGSDGANGASIVQSALRNTDSFKWHFFPNGEGWERMSSHVNGNRAVGVDGGSQTEGADAIYWDYSPDSQSEKIRLLPLPSGKFKLYFKHSGMVWDVFGGSGADGTPIRQYPSNDYNRQLFSLERIRTM